MAKEKETVMGFEKFIRSSALLSAEVALSNVMSRHILFKYMKVGKTVQKLTERYNQDYKDDYDNIELLYDGGTDGALIDWLEEEMIKHSHQTYGDKCKNEIEGGGPKCKDNATEENTAKVYVVYKD